MGEATNRSGSQGADHAAWFLASPVTAWHRQHRPTAALALRGRHAGRLSYQADPAAVAAPLPPGFAPAGGDCLTYFCDWQFTSDGRELREPFRSQYQEFFVVVSASYEG